MIPYYKLFVKFHTWFSAVAYGTIGSAKTDRFFQESFRKIRYTCKIDLMSRIMRIFLAVLGVASLVFVARMTIFKPSQAPTYQTARVERGTIVSTVSASGQVLSANTLTITTSGTGVVREVLVKDGDQVVSGQKIAEVELDSAGQQKNASAWSSYLSAKNSLDSAKVSMYSLQSDMFTKWKTYIDLATNSTYQNADSTPNTTNRVLTPFAIAQDDWLAAEAKYKNQQAVISQSQAAMSAAWASYQASSPVVAAPMAGTVGNITIVKGLVLSGTTAITIAVIQSDALPIATFNISEVDVSRVRPGQKATMTLDSILGKTFTGVVKTVDRIGQVTSGVTNYPVLVQFDTKTPEILPNMAATVSIIIESRDNVLTVPTGSLLTQNGQTMVRVLRNGQVTQMTVETGIASTSDTEIVNGVSEGDTVVTGVVSSGTGNSSPSLFSGGFRTGGSGGALRPGGMGGR